MHRSECIGQRTLIADAHKIAPKLSVVTLLNEANRARRQWPRPRVKHLYRASWAPGSALMILSLMPLLVSERSDGAERCALEVLRQAALWHPDRRTPEDAIKDMDGHSPAVR